MTLRYGIFKLVDIFRMQNHDPMWLEIAETRHEAQDYVNAMDCECVVLDSFTGQRILAQPERSAAASCPYSFPTGMCALLNRYTLVALLASAHV